LQGRKIQLTEPSSSQELMTLLPRQHGSVTRGVGGWRQQLKYDPIRGLMSSKSDAIVYFTRHDLLGEKTEPVDRLWQLRAPRVLVGKQAPDGAWKYHGGKESLRAQEDYNQVETYRVLRELIEKYGMSRAHSSIQRAAEFLFSRQAEEGDFRGIAGNQYLPYYTGGIMELLIKAGYEDDSRIEKGFRWLLSTRQVDGGWAFPLRTRGYNLGPETFQAGTVQPDKSMPFSHLVTAMVLRAFAAHPRRRSSEEARAAGNLVTSRFFKPDKYPDRRAASFWTSFSYPFWFTDLLSSLDSLSLIGIGMDKPEIREAVDWFKKRQDRNGLWRLSLRIMDREEERDRWISLAVCRVLKRLLSNGSLP
jgi:squalene-hopene cyclase-like protein